MNKTGFWRLDVMIVTAFDWLKLAWLALTNPSAVLPHQEEPIFASRPRRVWEIERTYRFQNEAS
jgi:hypothetical protein